MLTCRCCLDFIHNLLPSVIYFYFKLIDESVLCVHGGLSPDIRTIDQMRLIDRRIELPSTGPLSDLMWSDPEPLTRGWGTSPRGAGWYFGENVTQEVYYVFFLLTLESLYLLFTDLSYLFLIIHALPL